MIRKMLNKFKNIDSSKFTLDLKISIVVLILVILMGIFEGIVLIKNYISESNDNKIEYVNNETSEQMQNNQIPNSKIETASEQNNSETHKDTKKLPVLIEFYTDDYPQSKTSRSILQDIQKEYAGKINIKFVDLKTNRDATKKYNIKGIPTQIIFNEKGQEEFRHLGGYVAKSEVIEVFNELGI